MAKLAKTSEVMLVHRDRQDPARVFADVSLPLCVQVVLTGHAKTVSGIAWSCDGKRLATVSSDCTIRVWTVDQHKEVLAFTCYK